VLVTSSRVKKTPRPLKMGSIGCPETSVQNYHSTLRNIPEEGRYHLYRGGSLKFRTHLNCFPERKKKVSVIKRGVLHSGVARVFGAQVE
jgi:hypothetical protein